MEYTQLKRALERLDEMRCKYATAYNYDTVIADALRESLAQRFEYTLEVAWKTCKRHLSEQGFMAAATGSPKSIMRLAFSCGLISDATPWIRYIDARHNTAHDHSEKKLDHVIELIDDFFDDAVYLYKKMSEEQN